MKRNRSRRRLRNLGILAALTAAGVAWGGSVVQFMTSKSLPDATVSVIDPESGTSSGTTGSDVNIAIDDIILFRFAVAGAPASASASFRGLQSYLTEYVPPNTVLVGARMLDKDGNTIEPRPAGLAVWGCKGCNTFTGGLLGGSIAQVYADTGIFYSTTSLSGDPVPNNAFLTTENGIEMVPKSSAIDPQIVSVLNTTAPWYAHNEWDYDQLQAFGQVNSGNRVAESNTPFGYGSPVAGPDTYYKFEVSPAGAYAGTNGPWNRVKYPGSQIGTGPSDATSLNFVRVGVETTVGDDVTPLNPQPAKAVRFAMGEAEVGEVRYVEVALKVTGVPIDPTFGSGGGNVDCGEVQGSDASSDGNSATSGNTNPWAFFIPHPQCVFLRLKFDLSVDDTIAGGGQDLKYLVFGKNLATTTENNVRVLVKYSGPQALLGTPLLNGVAFPVTPVTCPAPDTDMSCLTFPLGNLAPSAQFSIEVHLSATGPGSRTNVVKAQYLSNQLSGCASPTCVPAIPAIDPAGFSATAITVVLATPDPRLALANVPDVTATFAAPGTSTWTVGGAGSFVINEGNTPWTSDDFTIHLPDGTFGVADDDGTVDSITIGTTDAACTHKAAAVVTTGNAIVRSGGTVTVNTIANHPFAIGDVVTISGSSNAAFNGTFQITSVPGNRIFTFAQAGANANGNSGVINDVLRVCSIASTVNAGASTAITFRVVVPALDLDAATTKATGVYTLGISTFGDAFDTFNAKAVEIPVGAQRTEKPILSCPISSSAPSISGSAEPTSAVRVLFNLQQRATATTAATPVAPAFAAWSTSGYTTTFGNMYGGLEVAATAQLAGELVSEVSARCTVVSTRECSDGFDNGDPEDTLIDFPADPGCTSPTDNSEIDPAPPQCRDGIDNPGSAAAIDWPADPACDGPEDNTENGVIACADGVDNDGDVKTDFSATPGVGDPDCTSATDGSETFYRQCQDGINNGDGDVAIDFPADPDCHSAFDDSEASSGSSPLQTKARILLAVDSSGSMHFDTCSDTFTGGDGSTECPGNAINCTTCGPASIHPNCPNTVPDDSRLYQVLDGLSNVVAGFGEVEYSLMRFHQKQMAFGCPTAAASRQSGGWQGGGASPCSGGFAAGDLLVSFAQDNEQTILDWMNHDSDYPGAEPFGTDFEIRGTGTTPLAGILESAKTYLDTTRNADLKKACRPYRVILVTDGAETCGGDPAAAATALRDSLPLVGTPPKGIPVSVIGFATPDPAVINNLDGIAEGGGTCRLTTTGASCVRGSLNCRCAIFVSDEAALSAAIAQIIEDSVLVEVCNGLDDDCDNVADEDFPNLDNACDNGLLGRCYAAGTIDCNGCNAVGLGPIAEECNGIDDDCDGNIDDGVAGCSCVPVSETCNGRDDNCNLQIDEGVLPGVGDSCGLSIGECNPGALECRDPDGAGGAFASLSCNTNPPYQGPVTETCNALDDDCDTFIDEIVNTCYGPTAETPPGCTFSGGVWTCAGLCRTGTQTCSTATGACDGDVLPVIEMCDGVDNDCDGVIDDGFNLGTACTNGAQGVCARTGTIQCNAAGGTECNAATITPGIETCDFEDEDCDGFTDELCTEDVGTNPSCVGAPVGNDCGTCGGKFICAPTSASDPTPIECGGSGSCCTAEVCDGADNDCDGTADDEVPGFGGECVPAGFEQYRTCTDSLGATCTAGTAGCTCVPIGECAFGHLECVGGGPDCRDYTFPAPEVPCNGIDEDCDGEDAVTCPGAQACTPAGCANPCQSGEFPCPFGFRCEEFLDPAGRFCVVDDCADVQCNPGFACDQDTGECFDLCDGVTCPTGQACANGLCQDCFTLGCPDGENCILNTTTDLGECVADACLNVMCEVDEFCDDGVCVALTCDPVCGEGQRCDGGTCVDDMCTDVFCEDGTVCNPENGNCVSDQCVDVRCDDGEACNPHTGDCIPDPCAQIECPAGFLCEIDPDDTATCREPVTPGTETIFGGGGGCCSTGSSSGDGAGALFLGAIGMLALRRRRRR